MIKLQTTALNHIPLSNFNLLDNVLTIDTKQFDLSKTESITEDHESPVYRFNEDIIIKLNIPKNRMFMFTNGNLFRFFDIDGNGILTVDELKVALDYILETDTVKLKADLKVIYDAFFDPKIEQRMKLTEIKKFWWDKGFPEK
jgi:hypothetical protein